MMVEVAFAFWSVVGPTADEVREFNTGVAKVKSTSPSTCAPQQPHLQLVSAAMSACRPNPLWFSSSRPAMRTHSARGCSVLCR